MTTARRIESICRLVPIRPIDVLPPRQFDPTKRSARAVRDEVLRAIIQRIWREHDQAYGSRKVWKQNGRGRPARGALTRPAFDARAGALPTNFPPVRSNAGPPAPRMGKS